LPACRPRNHARRETVQIKDEWYFNMRFADSFTADAPRRATV